MQSVVGSLPNWFVLGLALGAAGSLVVAVLFLAAARLFPTANRRPERSTDDTRRRTELREYLQAIDEQFAENHFVAGQPVAFYLPERDVAITFDARAYYRIARTETHPVLVEHEMPGVQLGARLPFETPEVTVGRSAATRSRREPTEAAFRELGVPPSASPAEIKRAYREKVKEVHPDHGGDEEAFRRVREAYTTAKQHAS
ncbi:MAG: J domain-containing protein [Haloarculaceae archaeon]